MIWTQAIVLIKSDLRGRLKWWVTVLYHCNCHIYQIYRELKAESYSTVGRMRFYIYLSGLKCSTLVLNSLFSPHWSRCSHIRIFLLALLCPYLYTFFFNIIQFCLNITSLGKPSLAILPTYIPPLYYHFPVLFCFTFLHSI